MALESDAFYLARLQKATGIRTIARSSSTGISRTTRIPTMALVWKFLVI